MSVYEASRLAGGNALFPATITLGKDEVTFKVPGLFDGKEKSLRGAGIWHHSDLRVGNG